MDQDVKEVKPAVFIACYLVHDERPFYRVKAYRYPLPCGLVVAALSVVSSG